MGSPPPTHLAISESFVQNKVCKTPGILPGLLKFVQLSHLGDHRRARVLDPILGRKPHHRPCLKLPALPECTGRTAAAEGTRSPGQAMLLPSACPPTALHGDSPTHCWVSAWKPTTAVISHYCSICNLQHTTLTMHKAFLWIPAILMQYL